MEVIIQPTVDAATTLAAEVMTRVIRDKPNAVLGLATGSTPLPLYQKLIAMDLDWSQVTTFNLDEYVGLAKTHPQSYHSYMWENFLGKINIKPENAHIPDGNASDIPAFCKSYEHEIKEAGGLDFQLLGIGTDGHIGFNEPSSSLASRTRIKTLTPRTRADNARFFGSEDEVPQHVITMGIGTIMEAREIMLLAFGDNKSTAIAATVEGPITALVPASILQMHPTAKIFLDEQAASRLAKSDYYRWVYENKPAWQRNR